MRIRADIEGEPAEGFLLGEVVVEPERLWLTGARSDVLRLTEVVTETIDITGLAKPLEKEVRLSLGGGHVWMEESQPITVRVQIDPIPEPEPEPATEAEAKGWGRKRDEREREAVRNRRSSREGQRPPDDRRDGAVAGPGHRPRLPRSGGGRRRIIIGKDTRLSGYLFEDALAAGICSMGVDVIQVGPDADARHGVPHGGHALPRRA